MTIQGTPRARRRASIVSLVVAGGLLLAACGAEAAAVATNDSPAAHPADHGEPGNGKKDRIAPETLNAEMRKLWTDHVTWTRLFLVSAIAGLPDLDATATRLLQNQDDIGAAIATFYGEEAGAQLSSLLREHILIAADLVAAAKAGDSAEVEAQQERWSANADEIAAFLASANPAWPEETLRDMMRTHLDQTLAEATARLRGDWATDVALYDQIVDHILEMADTLADGIVEQFPKRFTKP
jgi:hypothetical protein